MSDCDEEIRDRGKSLLIVEGNHEKNELFWLLFKCFSEIKISTENVWIYGTNIYLLYADIVKEYGEEWAKRGDDIDLPYVISKKLHPRELRYKRDFVNIILVFDYERHDPNFSEEKILELQNAFSDMADMGKLYLNYPMIESYQHLKRLPDAEYAERKVPVSLQPGKEYKKLVKQETGFAECFEFPHRLDDLLGKYYGVDNEQERNECCNAILNLSKTDVLEDKLQEILQGKIDESVLQMATKQLEDWITKMDYIHRELSFWSYMRNIFSQIVRHNISKANFIQYDQYQIEKDKYQEHFERLDLVKILIRQNEESQNVATGFIWVLCTCIFVVADYNFSLL